MDLRILRNFVDIIGKKRIFHGNVGSNGLNNNSIMVIIMHLWLLYHSLYSTNVSFIFVFYSREERARRLL